MQYNFLVRGIFYLILVFGFASPALSQEPVVKKLFEQARAIRVIGDHAYVVSGCGLFIYDITNKTNPALLSSTLINDNSSFDLEVAPPYAYVLSGELPSETATVTAVQISNRKKPIVAGKYQGFPTGSQAKDFILRGQILLVSIENRLELVDVTQVKNMRSAGNLQVTNEKATIPLIVRDGAVLFALYRHPNGSGIAAIETTNPRDPQILSRIVLPRKDSEDNRILPLSLAVTNHVLFVSRANLPVSLYDVTNPSQPKSSGTQNVIASGLMAEGDFLFTETSERKKLAIFETRTPLTPRFVREVDWSGNTAAMVFDPVQLQAYTQWTELERPGFAILKFNNNGTYERQATIFGLFVSDVEATGGIVYLTGSNKLAAVRRVPGKKVVEELGNIAFFESLGSFEIRNSRLYVSTVDSEGKPGVRTIDISDPTNMRELGTLVLDPLEVPALETQPRFDVQQNLMVIAFRKEGLAIYDVSSGNLQRLSTFRIPPNERALNATIDGDTAYLATSRQKELNLYAIDLRNAAQPNLIVKITKFDRGDLINDLKVDGNHLYVTGVGKVSRQVKSSGKLYIFSLENPARPVLLSQTFTGAHPADRSGSAEEIQIQGEVAYVADGVVGITVFDVRDKSNPRFLRAINTPSFVRGVSVDTQDQIHTADLACYLLFR